MIRFLAAVALVLTIAGPAAAQLNNPGGGSAPGGSPCALQFNDNGALGGFGCWDGTTLSWSVGGAGAVGTIELNDTVGRRGFFGFLGNNRVSMGTLAGSIAVDLVWNGTTFFNYNGDTVNIQNTNGVTFGGSVGVNITGGGGLYLIGGDPVLTHSTLGDSVINSALTKIGLRAGANASGKKAVCYDPADGKLYGSSTGTGCDD